MNSRTLTFQRSFFLQVILYKTYFAFSIILFTEVCILPGSGTDTDEHENSLFTVCTAMIFEIKFVREFFYPVIVQ